VEERQGGACELTRPAEREKKGGFRGRGDVQERESKVSLGKYVASGWEVQYPGKVVGGGIQGKRKETRAFWNSKTVKLAPSRGDTLIVGRGGGRGGTGE